MSAPLALAAILGQLAACPTPLPAELRRPYAAVVLQESAGHPYALHDNATNEDRDFATMVQAVAAAQSRRAQGHRIDAGIAQISSDNWPTHGLSTENVFDTAANLCAGAAIWFGGIKRAAACAYNTGKPTCSNGYPEKVAAIEVKLPPPSSPEPAAAAAPPLPVDAWAADDPDDKTAPPAWDAWAREEWERRRPAPVAAEETEAPAAVMLHASAERSQQ